MDKKITKIFIISALITIISFPVFAESLFRTGISQTSYPVQPKSLYGTVRAKTVGDIVTVEIAESSTHSNEVKLDISNNSNAQDKFTSVLNRLFDTDKYKSFDGYGGATTTSNNASTERVIKYKDFITTQVVQVLPNGNLVIQGKKMSINSGEKTQLMISGIVDPRFIDNSGNVKSNYVANFQMAVVGKGTVSASDGEGIMNKFLNIFF